MHFSRILAVAGHYGSGKTNLAVNLALEFQGKGEETVLADLDIVNPYFRSADFMNLFQERGIELIAPVFAGTNLDSPALTARLDAAILEKKRLVIDVGGDDSGAAALGRYSSAIEAAGGCDLLYVVNGFRFLTKRPEEACALLTEIEQACHMKATAMVNNSNLGEETTAQLLLESMAFARECARCRELPLLFTAVEEDLYARARALMPKETLYPVKIYVKKPWEKS